MLRCREPKGIKLLKSYHLAWLSVHVHRSEEWLKAKLADGFDIHHLDGNHANDDPANLVLIEHTDHMMLHGGRTLGRLKPRRKSRDGSVEQRIHLSRKRRARAMKTYEANWTTRQENLQAVAKKIAQGL